MMYIKIGASVSTHVRAFQVDMYWLPQRQTLCVPDTVYRYRTPTKP